MLGAAAQSVQDCFILCLSSVHAECHRMQLETIGALQDGSWQGYVQYSRMYSNSLLQFENHFTQSTDPVSRILQAHLLAVGLVFTPVTVYEVLGSAQWQSPLTSLAQIEEICESMSM